MNNSKVRCFGWLIVASLTSMSCAFPAAAEDVACNRGPLRKTYGSTPWLVYGCTDGQTLVIVSAPGSPAMPFVFSFAKEKGQYHLRGEGTGSRDASQAAFDELQVFSEKEIAELIKQAGESTPGSAD
ncbi:hypothetical protein D0B54_14135 [Solimonas sp. K1W22B-7]|nr:hypothetical protein D0B54_14135 [Solimonas sp. K1W22B-7]